MDLLYFAWVRERIGTGAEQRDPPEAVRNVADLIDWLATLSPGHAEAMREPERLRAAIDQKFVPLDTLLGDAREVAIFPPVTGG
ncbi:molybdopterin converting factor subunit 1 [Sphingomonas sp. 7/4-4]|jgi:molybdopterin synthase sulfur carrier subunit|uniref:molybdopterin converting factor subunit 1 n=1 Tax=Sphingomonas sp. 7/4-4 TaxID=3018446 RepID=UPI0022F3C752|nr:molybdopterin converting factor subunit 1 [Sphingomonas sp. 7/4-4]WBY07911.1 molybdopterin converting factor subunit 1 [Sphingomonas sp. 7/4-4]